MRLVTMSEEDIKELCRSVVLATIQEVKPDLLINLNSQTNQFLEPDEKFTISELAIYLGCTKATIHNYKNRGVFPYFQTGRTVFFKKVDVDKALASNRKRGLK